MLTNANGLFCLDLLHSRDWEERESWVSQLPDGVFDRLLGDRGYVEGRGPERFRSRADEELINTLLDFPSVHGLPPVPGISGPWWDSQSVGRRIPMVIQCGLPSAVDWREYRGRNAVTAVRNQGECGSCVSFGTLATVESMLILERNAKLDLSEHELQFLRGDGCGGWWISEAIHCIQEYGVGQEFRMPYKPCASYQPSSSRYDQEAVTITRCVELIQHHHRKAFLALVGPVVASLATPRDFSRYGSGIYREREYGPRGSHCIQIIGYDDREECWIAKNSWGREWGEDGFFRIAYGSCEVDAPDRPFWGLGGTKWWAD